MNLCIKKMGLAMFLCFGLIHSSEQKHSLPVAEFCANILDDNKYELVLTRNIEIPKNKKWNIPDSLDGGCTSWEYAAQHILPSPGSCHWPNCKVLSCRILNTRRQSSPWWCFSQYSQSPL